MNSEPEVGVEPTTYALQERRSSQLSYSGIAYQMAQRIILLQIGAVPVPISAGLKKADDGSNCFRGVVTVTKHGHG